MFKEWETLVHLLDNRSVRNQLNLIMMHKCKDHKLLDNNTLQSIRLHKFGLLNGSIILLNMDSDTYFQIWLQVYFSMILQKLSQSRVELNSTTMNVKQLQQMKNKTLCPNTVSLIFHKSFKRK